MSRIDELIAALCPEGVGFMRVGELLERTSNIRWQDTQGEEFQYIDLSSVDRNTHIIRGTKTINSGTAPSRAQQIVRENDVIFGTTRPMLKRYCLIPSEYDGQISSTGYCVFRPKNELLLPNFLFHLLGTKAFYSYVEANQNGASYPVITDEAVKAFRIPRLPVEVQAEIAKVLDTFTTLEAELEAELETRRRQYQYYRDALLTFGEGTDAATRVRWVTLGEIATYANTRIQSVGLDASSYVGVDNLLPDTRGKVRSNFVPTSGTVIGYQANDILIGNIRPYLKKIWLAHSTGGTNQDVLVIRIKDEAKAMLKPRYLYYLLASDDFFTYDSQHAKGAKMPRGDKTMIMKYKIPIPPLEVQARIVAVLDQFDTLVNDITAGLPAEIAARRQQYAYYRDRLLTFKEAV
ncbi:restriction endonuclease subunit S [Xylella fastidiosa subsp. fastidiosa]|jgi:type I restriction enzyme S subunit|uniref:Type I restriction-modification system specificity determinant n=2 Tax=Xylella fastidiosa TaxID=2371 RepID=Q879W5_XYLFT|nr:restriction endonuclease subunit S [Xylella fastidiosa]ADN62941.1 restriction modification system DNA specificity subunit [Xylella fastidiosa subsp. fastidiosa GB514]AAO29898.1 type I restriction-modification system specificity determinant [Xylella fastidiosa Temecula1]ACB93575.1 restriction modification system DNA specificity domain [Xylella fastidiosa M23]EGO82886.1 Restriction endonuclease S subunit [Xylella fastidiosa EB92.1]KGM19508.1 restriction endonuclease subunit S [Xylella fastidi